MVEDVGRERRNGKDIYIYIYGVRRVGGVRWSGRDCGRRALSAEGDGVMLGV